MSHIDRATVLKIARLARLEFTDAEIDELTGQLGSILSLVEQLQEVDVDGVEPMVHAIDLTNALADDQLGVSISRDAALRNAPADDGEHFLVPAVL